MRGNAFPSPSRALRTPAALAALLVACAIPSIPAREPLRDVLAGAFSAPFLTTAEVEAVVGDARGRIRTDGGTVLFRYRGLRGVTVNGTPVPARAVSPDVVRISLPAGTFTVDMLTDGPTPETAAPDPAAPAAVAPEQVADAVRACPPGGTVVVRDGIVADLRADLLGNGTPESPVTVRPETPGGVVFTRDTRLVLRGTHLIFRGFNFDQCGPGTALQLVDAAGCRVTGCRFFRCGNPRSTFGHIVEVGRNSHRNRVDHCFFTGSKSMSLAQRVRTSEPLGTDNLFDRNLFRDIYRHWINGQENIQIGQNQRGASGDLQPRCTVEYNLFDHAWGDGEIISNKSSDNRIRYNVAAHCMRSAFTLRGGNGVLFEGNVMVGNDDGLRVMGTRHTIVNNLFLDLPGAGILFETGSANGQDQVATEETLVAHNTFVDCFEGALGGMAVSKGRPFAPARNRFINNLVLAGGACLIDTRHLRDTAVRNNLFATRTGRPPDPGGPFADLGDHPIQADPKLRGSGLSLQPGPDSPAVDRGLSLPEVPRDREGRPRPRGNAPDAGATEVGAPLPESPPELPPIPPAPLLSPELYMGELLHAGAPDADDEPAVLSDTELDLPVPLPEAFMISWEHTNTAFADVAEIRLLGPDGKAGYAFSWGGADADGKPVGAVELRRLPARTVLADGADLVHFAMDYTYSGGMDFTPRDDPAPDPQDPHRFVMIVDQNRIVVCLAPTRRRGTDPIPVLAWEDPAPETRPTRLCLVQKGTGHWNSLRVRAAEYAGDRPPEPPQVTATAHGAGRIALRTADPAPGTRLEIARMPGTPGNAEPPEVPESDAPATGFDDFDVEPDTAYVYRVRAVNPLGLASEPATVRASTAPRGTGPAYIRLPAGDAAAVAEPMARVSAPDGTAYLWAPGAAAAMTEPAAEGGAEFRVVLDKGGTYAVWGLVEAPDQGSDSFHIAVDPGGGNPHAIWYTGVHARPEWSPAVPSIALTPGPHTISVRHREPRTRLFAILLTDDPDFAP